MLVELDINITYRVAGTFDIPRDIVEQIDYGVQECPSKFTEWLAYHIDESDAIDWEYDVSLFNIVV